MKRKKNSRAKGMGLPRKYLAYPYVLFLLLFVVMPLVMILVNAFIANGVVIVPTYRCDNDEKALCILESLFPDRRIVGIDSTDIIWGLGSFHCLSQQEPSLSE